MKCRRCGTCCINQGYNFPVEKNDLKRWINQNQIKILRHLKVRLNQGKWFCGDELKAEQIKSAEAWLWFSPRGKKLRKCPFLRKERNKSTYKCLINDTKPDRCRKWKPWKYGLSGLQGLLNFKKDLGYQCCKQKRRILTRFETKLDKKTLSRLRPNGN